MDEGRLRVRPKRRQHQKGLNKAGSPSVNAEVRREKALVCFAPGSGNPAPSPAARPDSRRAPRSTAERLQPVLGGLRRAPVVLSIPQRRALDVLPGAATKAVPCR